MLVIDDDDARVAGRFGKNLSERPSFFIVGRCQLIYSPSTSHSWYQGVVKGGQVDSPLTFRATIIRCVLNYRTIKVCGSCSWFCPGTFAPTNLTMSFYLCRSRSKATHKASQGPLQSAMSAQKAIQGSKTELLEGTEEKSISLKRGVIDLPSKSMFYCQSGPRNTWLPASSLLLILLTPHLHGESIPPNA